jgi:predicted ATPase
MQMSAGGMDIANHTPEVIRTRTVGWGHEQGNRGWAVFRPGQETAGIGQMRQGLAALQATGGEERRPLFLALLAEAYGGIGQIEEGLHTLAEALAAVEHTGGRFYYAELHQLKGELLRARAAEPDT